MEEKDYRQLVDQTFKELARAFDAVDPDVAEFEYAHGAVTIAFADGAKCILSTQPSVRQIWLAAASRGVAVHFDYDPAQRRWIDDKGKGLELRSYLRKVVHDATGQALEV